MEAFLDSIVRRLRAVVDHCGSGARAETYGRVPHTKRAGREEGCDHPPPIFVIFLPMLVLGPGVRRRCLEACARFERQHLS